MMMNKKSAVMPARLMLKPTRADALAGVCNSPTKCMYAMHLRRLYPAASYIAVNPNSITITMNGHYYHYMIPKKGVASMALYDNAGKSITDIDIDKSVVQMRLAEVKPCKYHSTPETREYHRKKSAKHRAAPGYVRPDTRYTLRGKLARSYLVKEETHAGV